MLRNWYRKTEIKNTCYSWAELIFLFQCLHQCNFVKFSRLFSSASSTIALACVLFQNWNVEKKDSIQNLFEVCTKRHTKKLHLWMMHRSNIWNFCFALSAKKSSRVSERVSSFSVFFNKHLGQWDFRSWINLDQPIFFTSSLIKLPRFLHNSAPSAKNSKFNFMGRTKVSAL